MVAPIEPGWVDNAVKHFLRSLEIHGAHWQLPGLAHPSLRHVSGTIDIAMLAEAPEAMSGWWDS